MKKISKTCNKKSFSLLEVMMALIIATVASVYVIKQQQQSQFNSAVKEMQDSVQLFVEDYIINANGYASDIGKNCSDSFNYSAITGPRVVLCSDLKEFTYGENSNQKTILLLFFIIFRFFLLTEISILHKLLKFQ